MTVAPVAPVALEVAGARCVVDPEQGGRLASLTVGGVERLLTTPSPDVPAGGEATGWGVFLMAPWVGRLDHGRLPFAGRGHDLPPTVDAFAPHAIHGVTVTSAWEVEQAGDDQVTVTCPLDPPWPFGGSVRQHYTLEADRLRVSAQVTADGQAMPAALGWHPWFARPPGGDVRLRLDAARTLHAPDGVPSGDHDELDDRTDLRHGPALGDRRLDTSYVGVTGPARLVLPDLTVQVDFDERIRCVTVYTPGSGVCVEPQTAWPNAPALHDRGLDTGLVELEPGQSLTATMSLRWS